MLANRKKTIYVFLSNLFWPSWDNNSNWLKLRPVGNLIFLKISYVSLLIIPVLSSDNYIAKVLFSGAELDFFVFYFGSLFLALANIIYDIFCPAVIKRFQSPNDLYFKMLEIKKLSFEFYPEDKFNASIAHCKEKFKSDKLQSPNWGRISRLLFLLSLALFFIVFLKRSISVIISVF